MYEDSIQTASSVEVVESRKRSLLRPVVFKGDSFLAEPDEGRKPNFDSAPKASSSTAHSRPPPAPRGATYQPDWTQDAENAPIPSQTVDDLGSPEDLKDVLRMGITQEMRVS
jgi:choline transport protein